MVSMGRRERDQRQTGTYPPEKRIRWINLSGVCTKMALHPRCTILVMDRFLIFTASCARCLLKLESRERLMGHSIFHTMGLPQTQGSRNKVMLVLTMSTRPYQANILIRLILQKLQSQRDSLTSRRHGGSS